jgi:hypothetical protein
VKHLSGFIIPCLPSKAELQPDPSGSSPDVL